MVDVDLMAIQKLLSRGKIKWSLHVIERMEERGVARPQVLDAIMNGKIIERRPHNKPNPKYLILNNDETCLFHVSVGMNEKAIYIITVYYPDENRWEADFATRKR